MKIPREIDDLMWEVAESDKTELIDDFGARYPDYKPELVNRLKMVRELKGAKPKSAPKEKTFHPTPAPVVRKDPRTAWIFALAGCLLLTLGVLAGTLISQMIPRSPVVGGTSPGLQTPVQSFPAPSPDNRKLEQDTWIPSPPPSGIPAAVPDPPLSPFDRKITVQTDRARLSQVLGEVAMKAGVRLQAGPGMPDPDIVADYAEMPAITILNDLGRNFGFTTLKQTETEALLVPAVDPRNPPQATPGGFAEAIGGEARGGSTPPDPVRTDGALPAPGLRGQIGR